MIFTLFIRTYIRTQAQRDVSHETTLAAALNRIEGLLASQHGNHKELTSSLQTLSPFLTSIVNAQGDKMDGLEKVLAERLNTLSESSSNIQVHLQELAVSTAVVKVGLLRLLGLLRLSLLL